jgi:flagellar hook-length control protein FliK
MTSTADSSLSTANVSADPTKSSFASVATVNPITNTAVNSEMAAALQTGLKNGTGNPSGQANGADNLTTTTTTAKGSISAMVTALGGQIQQVTLPTQANAGTAKVLTQMGANPQVNSAKTQPAQSPVPIAQKADNATNNFTGQNSKEEDNSAELAEHTDSTELVIPEKAVVTTDISFAGVLNQQSVKTSQEPIATEAVETTATPNQDPNNVLGQVIQQAQLLNHSQSSQMVIKLQPEHLGEMTLKIVVNSAGGVTASFHSDNPDVRSVLQSSMTQLRQELSTQGLKVAEVGVYASLDQFNPKQQQANQQQNQTRRYNSNRGNVAASEVIEEFGSNNSFRDSGVDYRI